MGAERRKSAKAKWTSDTGTEKFFASKANRTRTGATKKTAEEKDKKKRKPRLSQDIMIVTPGTGQSFADFIKGINGAAISEEGPKISNFSKTRKGEMLIKLYGKVGNNTATTEALKKAIGTTGELRSIQATTTVRIFDLNSETRVDQIETSVRKAIPGLLEKPQVNLSHPNTRE